MNDLELFYRARSDNNNNYDVDDPDRVIFFPSLFSISSSSLLSLFSVSHLILLFFLLCLYVSNNILDVVGFCCCLSRQCWCVSCFSLLLYFQFFFLTNSTSLIFNSSLSSYFSHNEYEEEKNWFRLCIRLSSVDSRRDICCVLL